ncbi:MAG: hypothetical protein P4L75_01610 [Clostridia bacterium]|nr:hypothetical protein [Clostridia bacterium]MDR3645617.1 hypothetical protein [Clostridia bacterium]
MFLHIAESGDPHYRMLEVLAMFFPWSLAARKIRAAPFGAKERNSRLKNLHFRRFSPYDYAARARQINAQKMKNGHAYCHVNGR